jgi:hypothetical protein
MPSVGSSIGVSSQSEIIRESVETSAADPLRELIKIYDDDEIP